MRLLKLEGGENKQRISKKEAVFENMSQRSNSTFIEVVKSAFILKWRLNQSLYACQYSHADANLQLLRTNMLFTNHLP